MVWQRVSSPVLTKVFREGTYRNEFACAGHPLDNPHELFASFWNLWNNHRQEFVERITWLDEQNHLLISNLISTTQEAILGLQPSALTSNK
jgi:hypothetical protein